MIKKAFILLTAFFVNSACAQQQSIQLPTATEQQLENLTEQEETDIEDDTYIQALIQLQKSPINLNTADQNELRELRILSDLQIQSFVKYKRLLGNLISIYELQAVPYWDIQTIHNILPFVKIGNSAPFVADMHQRLAGGQHSILFRLQEILEKSKGFKFNDSLPKKYLGNRQRLFFRYKYVYRNLLQFGVTGEKDAGEQIFAGRQKHGFDFYSFHLFARKIGIVKSFALGDFTVNLGQGLMQWQSLAFKKSADITAVKRQADVLRPYNSSGEFNFMRGAGITLGGNNINATAFASVRNLDATVGDDTTVNIDYVSSIISSGYHRTPNEISKKNILTQTSFGGNISYNRGSLHMGINGISFKFSLPLLRDYRLYNQYAINGSEWHNYSFDYGYTFKNFHLFGEAAIDKRRSKAFIGGIIASLDPKVDASMVYRNIEQSYQALYGNAFTEGTSPTNEKGLFSGLSIKPSSYIKLDGYVDLFSFPWLRYRVDAPSHGTEYLFQVTFKQNKKFEIYSRLRSENKVINISTLQLSTTPSFVRPRLDWRVQSSYAVSSSITFTERIEMLWFDMHEKERKQQGLLSYIEARYKPWGKPYAINGRLQYFNADSSDSRMYSFEKDVLYSYSIPQYIGTGFRYYINVDYDISKKMTIWLRWAKTIYAGKTTIGSGLDEIDGNKKSEIKLQFLYNF